jgi:hypothetical protein
MVGIGMAAISHAKDTEVFATLVRKRELESP